MHNDRVVFETASFPELNKFIEKSTYSKFFVLVDENTHRHCFPLLSIVVPALAKAEILEIEPGESSKNMDVVVGLLSALQEHHADRSSLLINLGGGVVSDIGGFVASIYKRGIDYINVPTSLLAMVDASYGGKTGVNLNNIKNHIGTFYHPKATFIYRGYLKTLEKRYILEGNAELIKHALISDAQFWQKILKELKPTVAPELPFIRKSVCIKKQIVKSDATEKNIRKILNFGHTIGHAYESYAATFLNKPLTHGHAIAIGMMGELMLSVQKCGLPEENANTAIRYLARYYKVPTVDDEGAKTILDLMKHDKKNQNADISFCLLKEIGNAVFDVVCSPNEIYPVIQKLNSIK